MKRVIKLSSLFLVIMFLFVLSACVPKDLDEAVKKLEKAGYTVTVIDDVENADNVVNEMIMQAIQYGSIIGYIYATNEEGEFIRVFYCSSSDYARKFFEPMKNNDNSNVTVKRSGKWIYAGTKQAVKVFKE